MLPISPNDRGGSLRDLEPDFAAVIAPGAFFDQPTWLAPIVESWPFEVRSRWFAGAASISTHTLDELLGTKLRALYQRREGRDLFDLRWAATHAAIDFVRVVACSGEYLTADGLRVSREELEANLSGELQNRGFAADPQPLLAPGVEWGLGRAAQLVFDEIAPRLPGEARKGPWVSGPAARASSAFLTAKTPTNRL